MHVSRKIWHAQRLLCHGAVNAFIAVAAKGINVATSSIRNKKLIGFFYLESSIGWENRFGVVSWNGLLRLAYESIQYFIWCFFFINKDTIKQQHEIKCERNMKIGKSSTFNQQWKSPKQLNFHGIQKYNSVINFYGGFSITFLQ